jgi:hypothetical protein
MTNLNKALEDIGSIRRQVARTTEFRGYGPATLAATGGIALLAAGVQAVFLQSLAGRVSPYQVSAYLGIWLATAVLSAATIGVQMVTRSHRIHSGLADEMIHMAVEQFLPAVGAGALITVVLVRFAPTELWMLPGLWQVISSLGLLASCRFLPRRMVLAGVWYLVTGLVCLSLGGNVALSPWAMGVPYGAGQLLVAGILYFAAKGESDAA